MTLTLRPETDQDLPFLLTVFASTRTEELALTNWTAEQKDEFLRFQFNAQRTDYRRNYPDASYDVILLDGVPAGRLYVQRRRETIHVLDIALVPGYRGRGTGTAILTRLQQEAATKGLFVSIHVERFNPAKRLYERLGFKVAGEPGPVYQYMEWAESPVNAAN